MGTTLTQPTHDQPRRTLWRRVRAVVQPRGEYVGRHCAPEGGAR